MNTIKNTVFYVILGLFIAPSLTEAAKPGIRTQATRRAAVQVKTRTVKKAPKKSVKKPTATRRPQRKHQATKLRAKSRARALAMARQAKTRPYSAKASKGRPTVAAITVPAPKKPTCDTADLPLVTPQTTHFTAINTHVRRVVKKDKKPVVTAHTTRTSNIQLITTTQRGAECGYEALNNAVRKMQELAGTPQPAFSVQALGGKDFIIRQRDNRLAQRISYITPRLETTRQLLADLQRNPRDNAQLIQAMQTTVNGLQDELAAAPHAHPADGQWLNEQEIRDLLPLTPLTLAQCTIIPNIDSVRPIDFDIADILRALRTTENARHAFIIGNMRMNVNAQAGVALKNAVTGSCGHWIAVVAHRTNNTLQYYVLDSLNGGHIPAAATTCIRMIESANSELFAFEAQKEKLYSDADVALRDNRTEHAMNNLERLIGLAIQAKTLRTPAFEPYLHHGFVLPAESRQRYKRSIVEMLEAIAQTAPQLRPRVNLLNASIDRNAVVEPHVGFLAHAVDALSSH